jgi:hypothetical protein
MVDLPGDVHDWVRSVFEECNERVTEKLSNSPNAPEESLDLSWVEHISRFSTPVTLGSSWTVKIETHYLGGLRHFLRWEIADIGVLLFIRGAAAVLVSKVGLLQSKRLYPSNMAVTEEATVDYEIGFARLADPGDLQRANYFQTEYTFTDECLYGALIAGSDQVAAIADYQKEFSIPVYYQLYNPWTVPFVQRVPLSEYRTPDGPLALGVRIVPANTVHNMLSAEQDGFRPSLANVAASGAPDTYGWRLEAFLADEFLSCQEGTVFGSINEDRIRALFNRRSGPIAAAISMTIDAPEGWEPEPHQSRSRAARASRA